MTLKSGSHSYVNSILSRLPPSQFHLNTPIYSASTSSTSSKVTLVLNELGGEEVEFDHVVFASHADTTLEILERGNGTTMAERTILGSFEFGDNRAVLHSDVDVSFSFISFKEKACSRV